MSNKITKNELHVDIVQELSESKKHIAEDAIHSVGGTPNAITVTTPQANYSYGQFKQLHFKASSTNTGNVTINVDGKGAVPALKFDGTQLAANAIKAGKIYDWYYDTASGGRFFLIAKASGTAVVEDVLASKPFSNDDGEFIGIMPNQGTYNITPSTINKAIPLGYHNGLGAVQGSPNLTPENIKKDVNMFGVIGSYIMPTLKYQSITRNTSNVTVPGTIVGVVLTAAYGSMWDGNEQITSGSGFFTGNSGSTQAVMGMPSGHTRIYTVSFTKTSESSLSISASVDYGGGGNTGGELTTRGGAVLYI